MVTDPQTNTQTGAITICFASTQCNELCLLQNELRVDEVERWLVSCPTVTTQQFREK